MHGLAVDALVVCSLVKRNLYVDNWWLDSLEGAGLVQILEYDESCQLLNDVHSETEVC